MLGAGDGAEPFHAGNDNRQRAVNKPQLPALITTDIVDGDAIAIGDLYARSRASFIESVIESVETLIECGRRLTEKKASPSIAHGEWLPWLEANAGVLGFAEARTAQRLMKAAKANASSTSYLDGPTALKLSRQMWGNKGEGNHLAQGTGENEWYTPEEYIAPARTVLSNIELDPCSTAEADEVVRAQRFYTLEDDGLSKEWAGKVWMNPPYAGDLIGKFAAKLCRHYSAGDVSAAVVLVNNATETAWFQDMAGYASAICFPRKRVQFWSPRGEAAAPLQGQALIYLGDNVPVFRDCFEHIGLIFYGS